MMQPVRVYIGFDARQPLAYTVCRSSVERHASRRVTVEPLDIRWLPTKRRGLTDFTFSRFLVPWLCDYRGWALFLDADIVVRADIAELFDAVDRDAAVSVSQGPHRFEWASVMLFWCGHADCQRLTPERINDETQNPLTFDWVSTGRLGHLPREWNHLVLYDEPDSSAKLVHYTGGIPCWPETKNCEHAAAWHEELRHATGSVSWQELMGRSVHRDRVLALNLPTRGKTDEAACRA